MTKPVQRIASLISALVVSSVILSSTAMAADDAIAQGKKIAVDRKKGNCLGCHAMGDGVMPGNIGPPLIAMKARYPDKAKLRAQIWDATEKNPHTPMPPFGKHGALSDKEIDLITEYVYSL
ncbi:MAG: sulfur oxidation c-type cytochrome SoxX [Gammaproteobacteria bacterium]|nr:sulfur oxidation c-type cytochrome SoxX [Gammaproteobacteria bacterium]